MGLENFVLSFRNQITIRGKAGSDRSYPTDLSGGKVVGVFTFQKNRELE